MLHQATPSEPAQRTVPMPVVPVSAVVAPVAQPEKKALGCYVGGLREPVWYSISMN